MRRAFLWVLGYGLLGGSLLHGADDPPPLNAPVELPPLTLPALPAPATTEAATGSEPSDLILPPVSATEVRPILAVPGLPDLRPPTARVSISTGTTPAPPSGIPLASPALELPAEGGLGGPPPLLGPAEVTSGSALGLGGPPPLVGPADLGGSGPSTSPLPAPRYSSNPPTGLGSSSLSLEPGSTAGAGRSTSSTPGQSPAANREVDWPTPPPPAPRRRLFGILPLPAFAARPGNSTDRMPPPAGAVSESRASLKLDVIETDDPDLAMERLVRTEIRTRFGNDLRSLDVRVNDRDIAIRAQASRFWQKRGLQRDLQALPILTGYRTRISVE